MNDNQNNDVFNPEILDADKSSEERLINVNEKEPKEAKEPNEPVEAVKATPEKLPLKTYRRVSKTYKNIQETPDGEEDSKADIRDKNNPRDMSMSDMNAFQRKIQEQIEELRLENTNLQEKTSTMEDRLISEKLKNANFDKDYIDLAMIKLDRKLDLDKAIKSLKKSHPKLLKGANIQEYKNETDIEVQGTQSKVNKPSNSNTFKGFQ